jgi:hypothetical protein
MAQEMADAFLRSQRADQITNEEITHRIQEAGEAAAVWYNNTVAPQHESPCELAALPSWNSLISSIPRTRDEKRLAIPFDAEELVRVLQHGSEDAFAYAFSRSQLVRGLACRVQWIMALGRPAEPAVLDVFRTLRNACIAAKLNGFALGLLAPESTPPHVGIREIIVQLDRRFLPQVGRASMLCEITWNEFTVASGQSLHSYFLSLPVRAAAIWPVARQTERVVSRWGNALDELHRRFPNAQEVRDVKDHFGVDKLIRYDGDFSAFAASLFSYSKAHWCPA